MSLHEKLFAAMYDRMIASTEAAGLREHRRTLLAGASGDVLEIGGGTGANLELYPRAVSALTITEPAEPMKRRLEAKLAGAGVPAQVVQAPAESLPFDDDSFDTVVSTLVLCSVDDQAQALGEVRRVLRPGGRLLFVEHVRSEDAKLARFQDRMNRFNKMMVRCDCNLDTLSGIRAAGFEVQDVEHGTLPKAPPWARPLIRGSARVA